MPNPQDAQTLNQGGVPFPPGWEGDITDPGMALRLALAQRMGGPVFNPFNPSGERMKDRLAAGLPAQYLTGLLGGQEQSFSDFINSFLSGETQPWSMGQATTGLQSLDDVMHRVTQQMSGLGDLSSPEGRQQALGRFLKGTNAAGEPTVAPSMIESAVAGYAGGDPQNLQRMMLGAFMPSLGPSLTTGLGRVWGPQTELWENVLGPIAGVEGGEQYGFMNLLSYLLGYRPNSMGTPVSQAGQLLQAIPFLQRGYDLG